MGMPTRILVLLKERQLSADIVLVDSHIRYSAAVKERPRAVASVEGLSGDLDRLASGRKGRVTVEVNVFSGDHHASTFTGTYMLFPSQDDGDTETCC